MIIVINPQPNRYNIFDLNTGGTSNSILNSAIINAYNVGDGIGIYSGKTNNSLYFKTIVAGDNITIDESDNEITINSIGGASTGSTLQFENGLTLNGDTVGLGGTITGTTQILLPNFYDDGSNKILEFKSESDTGTFSSLKFTGKFYDPNIDGDTLGGITSIESGSEFTLNTSRLIAGTEDGNLRVITHDSSSNNFATSIFRNNGFEVNVNTPSSNFYSYIFQENGFNFQGNEDGNFQSINIGMSGIYLEKGVLVTASYEGGDFPDPVQFGRGIIYDYDESVLKFSDGTNWKPIGGATAQNGLSSSGGTTIQLGGVLTQFTSIDGNSETAFEIKNTTQLDLNIINSEGVDYVASLGTPRIDIEYEGYRNGIYIYPQENTAVGAIYIDSQYGYGGNYGNIYLRIGNNVEDEERGVLLLTNNYSGASDQVVFESSNQVRHYWKKTPDNDNNLFQVLIRDDSTGEIKYKDASSFGGILDNTSIGLYGVTPVERATTGGSASTFSANGSGIANDNATFDGYTIGQIVKALRDLGVLT